MGVVAGGTASAETSKVDIIPKNVATPALTVGNARVKIDAIVSTIGDSEGTSVKPGHMSADVV